MEQATSDRYISFPVGVGLKPPTWTEMTRLDLTGLAVSGSTG
jgi:hypothetical protein